MLRAPGGRVLGEGVRVLQSLAHSAGAVPELCSCSINLCDQQRWASKKAGGSTQNGKDSNPKMLGIKMYGGEWCKAGNIIVRQRGTQFHPGFGVGQGRDHTLFALEPGQVTFSVNKHTGRRFVSIDSSGEPPSASAAAQRPTHRPRPGQLEAWATHPTRQAWLDRRLALQTELLSGIGLQPSQATQEVSA